MKKNLLLLAIGMLLPILTVFCQTENVVIPKTDYDTLRKKLNEVFAKVDKAQVPTRYLEEFGIPFVSLAPFNGTLTDSSRSSSMVIRSLLATLSTSHVFQTSGLPSVETLHNRVTNEDKTLNIFPIMVINGDYNILDPNAVTANLLKVQNDQLYDVAGRTKSPYQNRTIFSASPNRSFSQKGNISFVFKQTLHLQAQIKSVSNIWIDFGEGKGYVSASWNTPVSVNYLFKGTKRIKVKFRYSNGQILESHFDFDILESYCTLCRYSDPNPLTIQIPARDGVHSGAEVTIHYAGEGTRLVKPFVVAEGYDPFFISPNLTNGDYTVWDFFDNADTDGSFNFRNQLEGAGYDIVFINFNNGVDDIKRNADLFIQVMDTVNRRKTTAEQNVVMGMSMGGLVVRYGLAKMIKSGRNPQTRLLITHDSPHRGANTPLGTQALTRQADIKIANVEIKWLVPDFWASIRLLDAPASRQLLMLYATDEKNTVLNNFINGEYRSMITFSTPPPYKTIATSLGSQCGTGVLNPYTTLIDASGVGWISPFPKVMSRKLRFDINVRSLPAYGPSRVISTFRHYIQYQILQRITINLNVFNKQFNSPANTVPWDGAPGGTMNIRDEAGERLPTGPFDRFWFIQPGGGINVTMAGDFCFVPTVSALDLDDLSTNSISGRYVGGGTSHGNARVDNFIANSFAAGNNTNMFNRRHIDFTPATGRFLFNEMQRMPNNTANCSNECNPYSNRIITGNGSVCNTTTYSVPIVSGVGYLWTVSANLIITGGQGTANLTVRPNGTGAATVSFSYIKNGCTFAIPSRSVQAGNIDSGQIYIYKSGTTELISNMCPNTSYGLTVIAPTGTILSNWEFLGDFTSKSGSGYTASVTTGPNFGGGAIRVTATDPCGSSVLVHRTLSKYCPFAMMMSPNAATEFVDLAIEPADEDTEAKELQEESRVEILDKDSNSKKVLKLKDKKLRVNLSSFNSGIYFIKVTYKNETKIEKLLINK